MTRLTTNTSILNEKEVISAINEHAFPLENSKDLDPLMETISDARIVMLGEASHGTHEYYTWRTHITKRLIEEKGFNFIAVEGDWPDCYLLNRYIKGYDNSQEKTTTEVLRKFNRWPTWMWANWEIVALVNYLKNHNVGLSSNKKVGFYGLDVYSLWESMESIMQYLSKTDLAALKFAQNAYNCFEPYRRDEGQSYARASRFAPEICENEVVDLLLKIQKKLPTYNTDHENVFSAEQNALVAVNAEKYYRAMMKGGPHSWNVRDRHMSETLDRLLKFHGEQSKVIFWAHNTHVGDARATDMANEGMYNIGELARVQQQEKRVILVGFGSYQGSVIAGNHWGALMHEIEMPKARIGSWEYLLHEASQANKLLLMDHFLKVDTLIENKIGHRAIGVVYDPEHERYGNYVPTIIPLRYDAFLYLESTKALHPLHVKPDGHQTPETYPFGV